MKGLLVNFKGVGMLTQELKTLKDEGRASTSLISTHCKTFKYIYTDGKGNFIKDCTKAN